MSDVLDGPKTWFAPRGKTHHVQADFERDARRKTGIDKSLCLDAAARLDQIGAVLAHEADTARLHFRSDDFMALRDMQSFLETMAARIRAEWEIT